MDDLINRAMKELNEEGFLNGNKITEKGKLECEKQIGIDKQTQSRIFIYFWNKLDNSFYESDSQEFAIRILKFATIMKRLGVDLQECLEWIRGEK